MRLICPNCGAQYEVDEKVIPDNGRDVQCSNCGHAWFQRPAHMDADLAEELGQELPEPANDDLPAQGETPEAPAEAEGRTRRKLDPDVANVLREEAEHEAKVRQTETQGLETQTDLGLEDPDDAAARRSAAARARMARLRGQEDDSGGEAALAALATATGSRRDLLPDIDEVNTTLGDTTESPSPDHIGQGDDAMPSGKKRGFRRGLLLPILLAAIAVGVYAFAPQIITAVPASEPYLAPYVEWANTTRDSANVVIGDGITKVKDLIAGVTGDG